VNNAAHPAANDRRLWFLDRRVPRIRVSDDISPHRG
jgi:hypothetical protein